jgi:hypothetical protein
VLHRWERHLSDVSDTSMWRFYSFRLFLRCQRYPPKNYSPMSTAIAKHTAKFWLCSVNETDIFFQILNLSAIEPSDTEPIWYQTYLIADLSDIEPIRYRSYQIPKLSDTEAIRYQNYQIPSLSDTEPIRYRAYQIANPLYAEPIRSRTYQMLNLPETEPNRYRTYQIPNLSVNRTYQLLSAAHTLLDGISQHFLQCTVFTVLRLNSTYVNNWTH